MSQIKILSNLAMGAGSRVIYSQDAEFPASPSLGTTCFMDGVLYIYSTINGESAWWPLTNKRASYVHTQSIDSTSWTVQHNFATTKFGFFVYDHTNRLMQANCTVVNENVFRVELATATRGHVVVFVDSNLITPTVNAETLAVDSLTVNGADTVIDANGIYTNGVNISDAIGSIQTAFVDQGTAIEFAKNLRPSIANTYSIGEAGFEWSSGLFSQSVRVGSTATLNTLSLTLEKTSATNSGQSSKVTANQLVAKEFQYDEGAGAVVVNPKLTFKPLVGTEAYLTYDLATSRFQLGDAVAVDSGHLVLSKLTMGAASQQGLTHVGNASFTGGTLTVGTNTADRLTVNANTTLNGSLTANNATFAGNVTLGNGDDNVTVNAGASNPLTITSSTVILDASGNMTIQGTLTVNGELVGAGGGGGEATPTDPQTIVTLTADTQAVDHLVEEILQLTEVRDDLSEYDGATDLFTAQYAGIYLVTGAVDLYTDNANAGLRQVLVKKNGVLASKFDITTTGGCVLPVATAVELAAGDTLSVRVYADFGGSVGQVRYGNIQIVRVDGQNTSGGTPDLTSVASTYTPILDATYDIGTPTKRVRNIYFSGSFNTDGRVVKPSSIDWTGINAHVIPSSSETFDLGTGSMRWRKVYSTSMQIGGVDIFKSGANLKVDGNVEVTELVINNGTDILTLRADGAGITAGVLNLTYRDPIVVTDAATTTYSVAYNANFTQVYLNRLLLRPTEYTATNGTSITLGISLSVDDEIDVVTAY